MSEHLPAFTEDEARRLARLRVWLFSDAAPSRNGVGAYYEDLQAQLAPRLAELSLFSPRIEQGRWRAGLVLPMPGDATQRVCLPPLRAIRRQLSQQPPDLIVVATPGPYGLYGARLARRLGRPYLSGCHTSFAHLTQLYWPDSLRGRLVNWFFGHSHRYLFEHSHCVLGNSESILAEARDLGARQTRLIGTPLALDFVEPPLQRSQGQLQRLLFAGRLAPEKNLDSILSAAEALPALHFSIAGDGPLRAEVEAACQRLPNLHYLGWLQRDALCNIIDQHDALLLPSHYETFGTIALEAMARERLALVSSGCGISQWPELRDALCVIAEDGLTQTLQRLLALREDERRELAQRARECAHALNHHVLDEWSQLLLQTHDDGNRTGEASA